MWWGLVNVHGRGEVPKQKSYYIIRVMLLRITCQFKCKVLHVKRMLWVYVMMILNSPQFHPVASGLPKTVNATNNAKSELSLVSLIHITLFLHKRSQACCDSIIGFEISRPNFSLSGWTVFTVQIAMGLCTIVNTSWEAWLVRPGVSSTATVLLISKWQQYHEKV
jgi:hypothetical protein